jgi:hypothetical protein
MAEPKKKQRLDEDEVLTLVDAMRQDCVGWSDSKLSTEREKVLKYYNGELPVQQHRGSSSYRSSDVYDGVESMKTQVVETFMGNDEDIVSFPAENEQDAEGARDATRYTAYVVHRQNNFQGWANEVVHTSLMARVGVVKVYWDEDYEYEDFTADGLTEAEAMAVAAQDDFEEVDLEETEEGSGLFSGKLRKKIDRSQVRIDVVPPEEFGVSSRAGRNLEKADAVVHKTLKSKAEMIRLWPDKKAKITKLHTDASEITSTPESIARNDTVDAIMGGNDAVQSENDKITVYEAYVMLDLKDGRGVRRYKVCYAQTLILAGPEEVNRLPFKVFVPLPVPHTLWGNNFAARIIPTQNARTVLTRGVLDHTSITTNPRWAIVKGGLLNPKEMLDNRLGGIVNTNRPGAIEPIQYANLNPFIFEVLRMLEDNNDKSTGISSLSQGLNKDAVSTQNSQGLIDNLVTLSQQRQKGVARAFAQFLVEVYLEVYQLVLEHEQESKVVEIADGKWERFDPRQWQERRACRVSVNLGYGEKERKAVKYTTAYEKLASDPILAPVFGIKKRIKMASDTMKLMGFDNPTQYFDAPEDVPPPQPDPLEVKKLEIEEMKAKAALITAEATAKAKDTDAMVKMLSAKLDQISTNFDMALSKRESDRLDIETANRVDVSQREIKLAESAPAEGTNTIVSANG